MEFMGYRRADGRVGVRNYSVVISSVFCSSSVAQKIAYATGVNAVIHDGGCGQLGFEKDHTERVLNGVVNHPNVGAVLVVGLGCEQLSAQALSESALGKASRYINIHELGGNQATVESGIRIVNELKAEAEKATQEKVDISELILATQCGSSDSASGLAANPAVGVMADRLIAADGTVIIGETSGLYGAAGVMAKRAVSPKVSKEIIEITDVRERYYSNLGLSLKNANPTPGNIAGGLTTLVEKSYGGVRKGGTTLIQGVVKAAERIQGKGLWVMDTSMGIGACDMTDMLSSGSQVMAYTTGLGNPVGSPLAPVIKITGTSKTYKQLMDIIDFDASTVLRNEETIEECGERLFKEMISVANGKLTKAEEFKHTVFAVGKIPV